MYGGCVIEKSKLEQMWYATNSPKGILILKRTMSECKAAIDLISAYSKFNGFAHLGQINIK